VRQIPALLDFLPMIMIDSHPDLEGIVPGPIYPLFGVVTGACALGGGLKKIKGLTIAAMVIGIIQLIMVAWYGFIGVVMATICDGAEDLGATQDPTVKEFCDLMGLMTLTAILRFATVLAITICACCGVCCNKDAVAQPPQVVVVQTAPQ
jgi:hypothetical protein